MNEFNFVDTTLRDGQASLWAENMRTGMMLLVAERLDDAGFQAIEVLASSHLKKCVRELREDPFERIRLLARKIKKTTLRALGSARISAFELTPDSIIELWYDRMLAAGIRQLRVIDPANDSANWSKSVARARRVGLGTVVNLTYSVSPKHTDAYYGRKAAEAAALKPDFLCLKDPGGLLTPDRTAGLVRAIDGTPTAYRFSSTFTATSLGPLCALEAIKSGWKRSIPRCRRWPTLRRTLRFNVAQNARTLGYTPLIDEEPLLSVAQDLDFIAKREGFPIGVPVEYDYNQYVHQVPGGMISNLRHQLKNLGMLHRLDEVLEEAVRVRAELGYPIMVTPFSQFVGSQAAINVIRGERYAQVTDQVIQYALGHWGKEAADEVDPNIKDKLLGLPRAKQFARWRPPQPAIEEVRAKLGGPGVSDDELLMRYVVGKDDVEAMRAAAGPREYISARKPLLALLQDLTRAYGVPADLHQKTAFPSRLKRAGPASEIRFRRLKSFSNSKTLSLRRPEPVAVHSSMVVRNSFRR
jgi:oxaloacetate decarboxylase alpha subunit